MLTQEEWNEKQRSDRKSEFAWNYDDTSTKHKNTSPECQSVESEDDMVGPSLDMFMEPPNNPNKQTTITSKSFKHPIHNELNNELSYVKNKPLFSQTVDNDIDSLESIPLPSEPRIGVEIAPPPTYEYYASNVKRPRVQNNFISADEMQDSISKGLNNANIKNKCQQIRNIVYDEDDDDDNN